MKPVRKYLRSFSLASIFLAAVVGIAIATSTFVRDVAATVEITVSTPDGIEVYLDESLTQQAESLSFGTAEVDVFGTVRSSESVPVWVHNNSFSDIMITLTDDFEMADVILEVDGGMAVLPAGEVLPAILSLQFYPDGTHGSFNFTVYFQAEGPVSIPTPTPTPAHAVLMEFSGVGSAISEIFTVTESTWYLKWESNSSVLDKTFSLLHPETGVTIATILNAQEANNNWPIFQTIGTFRMKVSTGSSVSFTVRIIE